MRLISTLPIALLVLLPAASASPCSATEASTGTSAGQDGIRSQAPAASLGGWAGQAAAALRAVAQDPAPAPQDEKPGQEPSPDAMTAKSKADLLGEALLEAHGGAEAFENFSSLQFTVTPVQIRALPQAPGSEEPIEYEELPLAPIHFQAAFSGVVRHLRMDEDIELNGREHTTTKIVSVSEAGTQVTFMLDGQKRTVVAESREAIITDVTTLAGQFDILMGLGTRQLRGTYDGPARRGGVEYETVVAQFFAGINADRMYRLYLNPTTHLVDRYDLYDARSQRLTSKLEIAGYTTHEGLQLPGSLTFRNRQSEPFMRWEFTDYTVNAEIPGERFVLE